MKYRVKRGWDRIRTPVLGAGGAATGLVTSELSSEFTAKSLGLMGYEKAGIKTAVKGLVGALFFALSAIPGAALFTVPAAFSSWGSIVLDWIAAKWSGGITGLADKWAITVRKWSVGAEKVSAELAALEAGKIVSKFNPHWRPSGVPPEGVSATRFA